MDLFIKAKTTEQWIKKLKADIKKWGIDNGYIIQNKFVLASRSTEKLSGDPLFILPPFKGNVMYDTFHDHTLRNLCRHYNINKYSMTYSFPFKETTLSQPAKIKDIKAYSVKLNEIIQILCPSIIVILGELAQHSLLSKKFLLTTWHGMTVPGCEVKTLLMHPADYYCKRSKNEDKSFKAALRDNDWNKLKKEVEEYHADL
jgi:hypothetical protein